MHLFNKLNPMVLFVLIGLMSFKSAPFFHSIVSSESKICFSSKNASGTFDAIKGTIEFDEKNLVKSSFDLVINVASIHTGKKMQDKHAKGKDWFDAESYPEIIFRSIEVKKVMDGFEAVGGIEIKGIKKEINIPFKWSGNSFIGSFDVNRIDFAVGSLKGMQKHVDEIIHVDFVIKTQ